MPGNVLVLAPQIKLNGTEIGPAEYDSIIDLRVEQSVAVPNQLSARLADPGFELLDGGRFAVGTVIEVAFPSASTMTTVFDGQIVGIGVDQNAERPDLSELTIIARDRSFRLGAHSRVRTFQKQKYADVVRTVAGEHGLRVDVELKEITFDYLIQTTTDYAFLNEIAFRTGCEWRVEGNTLIFRARQATRPITVTSGLDLRRLKARVSASNEAKDVHVRSWDPRSKAVISGSATVASVRDRNRATAGTAPLAADSRRAARSTAGTLRASSLVATSSDEATELATSLSARIATSDLTARCECIGRPEISAGCTVELVNVGTKLSGEYYVTEVEHRFGRDDMTTTFTTGDGRTSGIVDLLGGRSDGVDEFGRTGLTIGIVTNNKDPDEIGRVRVKFPALSDQEESWWARVAVPGGGASTGLMMMPQIGDEVLVGFEHGDLRRPFVLGGLWGPKAKPPTAAATFLAQNKVVEWGLRTAAGATLAFRGGDQPSEKHFKVALADGTTQYMGSDKIEIVAQNKSIELKSGQASILITDRGDIQLRGTNITIEATNALKVNGLTVEAKGKTTLKAEGAAALELKGGGTASLSASGVTEVKGAMVKIN